MPLSTSAIAESDRCLKHHKNANQSLQDIPVDSTVQMLVNKDGVLKMGILQLVVDGALWRETILMFWN